MRKITVLATALAVVLSASSGISMAASTGTITFNGRLTDTTCNVDIEGQGADATVTLPTVSISELTAAGQTTGRTSFNMALSGCTISTEGQQPTVAAFFQPGDGFVE